MILASLIISIIFQILYISFCVWNILAFSLRKNFASVLDDQDHMLELCIGVIF